MYYLSKLAYIKFLKISVSIIFITSFSACTNESENSDLDSLLILAKRGSADAMYELGHRYYLGKNVEKDYHKAIQWWLKASDKGSAIAMNNLGSIYQNGLGVPVDLKQSATWYRKSADQNCSLGLANLSGMYRYGLGVEKNAEIAFSLMEQATKSDDNLTMILMTDQSKEIPVDIFAKQAVGIMYLFGEGVSENFDEAFKIFITLSRGKLPMPESDYFLGYMYENGLGRDIDYEKAYKWYYLSASEDNSFAQKKIGQLLETGRGIKQNINEAIYWYKLAAEKNNFEAMFNLGSLFKNYETNFALKGSSSELNASKVTTLEPQERIKEALNWFSTAADGGMIEAQLKLSEMYKNGDGVLLNNKKSISYLKMAAEQGHVNSQYDLGVIYREGKITTKNIKEALKWFQLAANEKHISSQYALGLLYAKGDEVTQDYETAFKLFSSCAMRGSTRAQFVIGTMYREGQGVEVNLVKAYAWFDVARFNSNEKFKKLYQLSRDELLLTAQELNEAQEISSKIQGQILK